MNGAKEIDMKVRAWWLAFALVACSPAAETAKGPVRSAGEVVVIQPEYAAITIRHEPIPEYGMGAMTMEFTTDDAAKLEGLAVGDRVAFELSGPTEIATIRKQ